MRDNAETPGIMGDREKKRLVGASAVRAWRASGVMPGIAEAYGRPALSIAWRRTLIYDRLPDNRA